MDQAFVTELEKTLTLVLSPDNAAIKQATNTLKTQFYTNPLAFPALIQILQTSQNTGVQQLAAVEAKKLVATKWEESDPALKQSIRDSLLQFAFTAPNKNIRHSTARIISAISEIDIANNSWPNLLESLVAAATDANQQTREMAVFTLYCILETFPLEWLKHTDSFLSLFSNTLQDAASFEVQVTSVSALDVIATYIDEDDELKNQLAAPFVALLPKMLVVLKTSLSQDDTDKTKELFSSFNSFVLLDIKLLET
ncbi:unnamed protein product [Ambrosiozyma monospora]|uniref:Unnamed protein product n=1 Tax=Ambrosiozyma monospora TaxID=43982 RepID=A0ACB5TDH5_AMBMO|nr:unnamed protein product [Ambrosiozyma monospora]